MQSAWFIRSATSEDVPLIANTIQKNSPRADKPRISELVKQKLIHETLIACSAQEPEVAIAFLSGRAAERALHYVYVKDVYRQMGVCNSLVEAMYGSRTAITYITLNAHRMDFFDDKFRLTYNPLILMVE